jgi:hypothetical protein
MARTPILMVSSARELSRKSLWWEQSLKALGDIYILKHLDLHNTESDSTFLSSHADGKFYQRNMLKKNLGGNGK